MIKKTSLGIERRPAPGATRILGRFCRENGGAMAIMVALLVPVLVGMMGVTVDVSLWYMSKRSLQNSADAAAVSGSLEIVNGNAAGAAAAAEGDAVRNGFDASDGSVITVNIPPTSGPNAGNSDSVEVIITRPLPRLFSTLFLDQPVVARVRAVANAISTPGNGCALALDPTASGAVSLNGGGSFELASEPAPGCALVVNSNDPRALSLVGNSEIEAPAVSVVGEIRGADKIEADQVTTGASPVADPLADMEIPPLPPCVAGTPPGMIITTSGNLPPGRYCGGLTVTGGAVVNLDGGEYFFTEGDLSVSGNSRIEGDESVIFLTGDPASSTGSLKIAGNSRIEFSAPTSGDFEGISIFQDRGAPTGPSNKNQIVGNSELEIDGTVYFPSQEIFIAGGSELETEPTGCAKFIARRITINGNGSEIELKCDPNAPSATTAAFGGAWVARLGE